MLGNELCRQDGTETWPGLIARDLGVDYATMAEAGCGNEAIARQIYTYFSQNKSDGTLAVINWTWCMRWDFFLVDANLWVTLGPTCVPGKLEHLVGIDTANHLVDFYHAHTSRSDIWNRFRSLQTMYAVQCWLRDRGIQSIETYMDPSIIDATAGDRLEHYHAVKDPAWPDLSHVQDLDSLPDHIKDEITSDYEKQMMPQYITALQLKVRERLKTFQGRTFLEWANDNGFPVTELLHPLEPAHKAAADYRRNLYRALLA